MSSKPGSISRSNLLLLLGIAVATAGLDQLTKAWALTNLTPGTSIPLIGTWLQFSIVHNAGAAFSTGANMTWVLTILAVVVVVVIVRVATKLSSMGWTIALGLLLGGAVGNLIDRLTRPPGFGRGKVVDFIDYGGWFVGNVADIAIVGAGILIVWLCLRGIGLSGPEKSETEVEAPRVEETGPRG